MAETFKGDIAGLTAQDLVALRHRINAARDQAAVTHEAVARRRKTGDVAFAPFLDACAKDLEDLAQLCRSVADKAARPECV